MKSIRWEDWAHQPMSRPGKYVLRMSLHVGCNVGHDDIMCANLRYEIHIFGGVFAAKKFIEAAIPRGMGFEVNPRGTLLRCESGLRVRNPEGLLNEVMDHEYTRDQDLWDLPRENLAYALRFARGVPVVAVDMTSDSTQRRARRAVNRSTRQGMTTVQDIAAELEMSPRDARAALRKRGEVKPAHGWAWAAGPELERIKGVIKG